MKVIDTIYCVECESLVYASYQLNSEDDPGFTGDPSDLFEEIMDCNCELALCVCGRGYYCQCQGACKHG